MNDKPCTSLLAIAMLQDTALQNSKMAAYLPQRNGPANGPPASACLSNETSSTSINVSGEASASKASGKRHDITPNHLDRDKVRIDHASSSSFNPFSESNFGEEYELPLSHSGQAQQETLFMQAPAHNQSVGAANKRKEVVQDDPYIPTRNWNIGASNKQKEVVEEYTYIPTGNWNIGASSKQREVVQAYSYVPTEDWNIGATNKQKEVIQNYTYYPTGNCNVGSANKQKEVVQNYTYHPTGNWNIGSANKQKEVVQNYTYYPTGNWNIGAASKQKEVVQDQPYGPTRSWNIGAVDRAMVHYHHDEEEDDGDSLEVVKKKSVSFEDTTDEQDFAKQGLDAVCVPPTAKSYSRFHQRNASNTANTAERDRETEKSCSSEATLVIVLPSPPSRPLGKPCHKNGLPVSPKDASRRTAAAAATQSCKSKQEDYSYKSRSLRIVASSDSDLQSSRRAGLQNRAAVFEKTKARARARAGTRTNRKKEFDAAGSDPQKLPMNDNAPPEEYPNSNKKRARSDQIPAGVGVGRGRGRKCRYRSVKEVINVNPPPPPPPPAAAEEAQTAEDDYARDLLGQCLRMVLWQINLKDALAAANARREAEMRNDAGGGESGAAGEWYGRE